MNISVISNVPNVANQKGAVAFEYALIIVVVGVGIAATLAAFGSNLGTKLLNALNSIATT